MKKLICLVLLTLGLLLVFAIPVWADNIYEYNKDIDAGHYDGSLIMSHLFPRFLLDGEVKTGDVPRLVNNRLLLPLRQVGEAFKAKVDWDEKTQKATVTVLGHDQKERTVTCGVGNNYLEANGEKITLDVPAKMYDGRIYLPLRALGEALGKYVDYHDIYKLAVVSDLDIKLFYNSANYSLFRYYDPSLVWIALQGWPAVYGDNYIVAYTKDDGKTYLHYWGHGDYLFDVDRKVLEYVVGQENDKKKYSQYDFVKADSGDYFVFNWWADWGDKPTFVYSFDDNSPEKFKLICGPQPAMDIKFHKEYIYLLILRTGGGFWFDIAEHSNLKRISIKDKTEEYLGLTGFIYGITPEVTEDSSSFQKNDWEIKDDGVYISGFYDLDTGIWTKETANLVRNYRVNLTGGGHTQLPD
ncbi:MAG: copper amine oxidase N-terminal domain-containing protein [Clostridiales bacterium]|nr:copper amine oxidase N-terminal domain-containing protein [Clostridiales bacterium]